MKTLRAGLFLVALLWSVTLYANGVVSTTAISSSSNAVQVAASIERGLTVTVPITAATPVWFVRYTGTCSSGITSPAGVRVTAGNGYNFVPRDERWAGQVCMILESGSSSVTVDINEW
jgi:hypothetical protein